MICARLPLLAHERLSPRLWRMTLEAPQIATQSSPGQFVTVAVGQGYDPLLRRPLGIHRVEGSTIQLLYQVVGRGTALLSKLAVGAELDVLGPLGHGFSMPAPGWTALLIAGGIGAAPLLYLAQQLRRADPQRRIELYFGGRSAADLVVAPEFERLDATVKLTTDDGSQGRCGLITEALELDLRNFDQQRTALYACGPTAMLKAVARLANGRGLACEVSLERQMACGVGSCMGCVTSVIKTPTGRSCDCGNATGYERVCVEGPVFDAKRVEWANG